MPARSALLRGVLIGVVRIVVVVEESVTVASRALSKLLWPVRGRRSKNQKTSLGKDGTRERRVVR